MQDYDEVNLIQNIYAPPRSRLKQYSVLLIVIKPCNLPQIIYTALK